MFKKIALGLLIILLIIQFIKPEKNLSDDQSHNMALKYPVSGEVKQLLRVACDDCHSNKTAYPWYVNIQPVAWFLDNHVQEGKGELNFSTFTKLPIAVQNHKFDEIIEVVEEKEMPLESYTFFGLHKEANLTDQQREVLVTWAKQQMMTLKNEYPADSLKMKKRTTTN
ncbi:heme-binding domain-containing protein [Dyadobacter sp. CY345]|uniref:heme-binding domain-containing protein n=1 Tax=Dyadobacter sp. CY345 TaxID=2909335 RepID=UPI001F16A8E2|nr:heme-binding domain-containing protein [Dyadobacter sp. CY345]MCF2443999.1 heme-binding domain-containing protein [Dyadobacter sp. CY345]